MNAPIIHVVQHLAPGGLEVMALELARVQAASRPTFVVSLEGEATVALGAWPRLAAQRESLVFMGKNPGLDVALPFRLAALFRGLRPAAVHTHHAGPLLYAGVAARLARVPRLLHTEHDAWHLADPRRRRLMRAALAVTRPVLIADAPHVADAVRDALGIARPRVVLNGVDTDRFAPRDRIAARAWLGLPRDAQVLGIAARLEKVKGVDIAIAALPALPGVILAIAGQGTEALALRAQAEVFGVADRVRFLGLVEDMPGFFAACDAVCLPSRDEGLPLAALEAQACGVPVVAAEVGGVVAACDPATARFVPAQDPAALAVAVGGLLSAPRGNPRDFVQRTASLATAAHACLDLALAPERTA
jgi:glycosyltransferase involved in cell wall biosynthesis